MMHGQPSIKISALSYNCMSFWRNLILLAYPRGVAGRARLSSFTDFLKFSREHSFLEESRTLPIFPSGTYMLRKVEYGALAE